MAVPRHCHPSRLGRWVGRRRHCFAGGCCWQRRDDGACGICCRGEPGWRHQPRHRRCDCTASAWPVCEASHPHSFAENNLWRYWEVRRRDHADPSWCCPHLPQRQRIKRGPWRRHPAPCFERQRSDLVRVQAGAVYDLAAWTRACRKHCRQILPTNERRERWHGSFVRPDLIVEMQPTYIYIHIYIIHAEAKRSSRDV